MATTTISRWSDFDISFKKHPVTSDLIKIKGVNSVVQSLKNLVQLNHTEVPFHPEIGGDVRSLLFEIADSTTAGMIEDRIKLIIQNFEPRAIINDVNVQTDSTGKGYNITIKFGVVNTSQQYVINTFLSRLR